MCLLPEQGEGLKIDEGIVDRDATGFALGRVQVTTPATFPFLQAVCPGTRNGSDGKILPHRLHCLWNPLLRQCRLVEASRVPERDHANLLSKLG